MRQSAIRAVLFALLVGSGIASSQGADVNLPDDAVQYMEFLVGQWDAEGSQGNDKWKARYSYQWAPGKQCVIFRAVFTSDTDGTSAGAGIIGWDAAKKEIVETEFWSDGWSHRYNLTTKAADAWEGRGIGTDGDGNAIKQKQVAVKKKGPDSFTWSGTGVTRGEEAQPDYVLNFTRTQEKVSIPKQAPTGVPEEILESMEYYTGRWSFEWTDDEGENFGRATSRWAPGKHCIIGTTRTKTPKGVKQGAMLSGWDAHTKQIVDAVFDSDGFCQTFRWDITSPELEEATRVGASPEGETMKSNVRIEKKPDAYRWIETDRTEGGESLSDIDVEVHRMASGKKTKD